jgi:hypothetical protein
MWTMVSLLGVSFLDHDVSLLESFGIGAAHGRHRLEATWRSLGLRGLPLLKTIIRICPALCESSFRTFMKEGLNLFNLSRGLSLLPALLSLDQDAKAWIQEEDAMKGAAGLRAWLDRTSRSEVHKVGARMVAKW